MTNWHQIDPLQALEQLGTSLDHGLSQAEAARLQEEYGANELVQRGVESPWAIFWDRELNSR